MSVCLSVWQCKPKKDRDSNVVCVVYVAWHGVGFTSYIWTMEQMEHIASLWICLYLPVQEQWPGSCPAYPA